MKKTLIWVDPTKKESCVLESMEKDSSGELITFTSVHGEEGNGVVSELLEFMDLKLDALEIYELNTEFDWDQLFYQKGFKNDSIATFKVEYKNEIYDIEVLNIGTQEVAGRNQEPIKDDPERLLKERQNLHYSNSCWIDVYVSQGDKDIGSSMASEAATSYETVFEAMIDVRNLLELMVK